jgi:hypothetical protein
MRVDTPLQNLEPLDSSTSPRNATKARVFGKNMRHLIKLVTSAFLNPSKFWNLKGTVALKIFHSIHRLGCR